MISTEISHELTVFMFFSIIALFPIIFSMIFSGRSDNKRIIDQHFDYRDRIEKEGKKKRDLERKRWQDL